MIKNYIREGNKKLPKETAIFNITSATDCPSAKLGLCQLCNTKKCYARRAEVFRPAVLPFRRRQAAFWDNIDPETFAAELLAYNSRKRRKLTKLRINEAGDLRGREDLKKVSRLSDLLKNKIRVYMYTARKDLSFAGLSDNLTINASGFKRRGLNTFKAVKNPDPKAGPVCPGDCRRCDLCSRKHGRAVQVKLH